MDIYIIYFLTYYYYSRLSRILQKLPLNCFWCRMIFTICVRRTYMYIYSTSTLTILFIQLLLFQLPLQKHLFVKNHILYPHHQVLLLLLQQPHLQPLLLHPLQHPPPPTPHVLVPLPSPPSITQIHQIVNDYVMLSIYNSDLLLNVVFTWWV